MKRFNGFTLAEVLVTLVIIGVISAMTIPSLRKNTDEKANITKLQKVYAEVSQASKLVIANNNVNTICRTGILNDLDAGQKFYDDYFNHQKKCINASNDESCIGPESGIGMLQDYSAIMLTNGVGLAFEVYGSQSCLTDGQLGNFHILVDINGPQKPNKGGVDRFFFTLHNNGEVFMGLARPEDRKAVLTDRKCNASGNTDDYNAFVCATHLQLNGWKVDY